MTRRVGRGILRFLGSAKFATWLLVVVSAWSVVASFVPQDRDSPQEVAAWAAAHPVLEPLVRMLGLHQAFSSFVFIACAIALALSTALCAWRRTKVAISRMRSLREAAAAGDVWLSSELDVDIACAPGLSESEVLSVASDALARCGIKTKRRGGLLSSVSPAWSVWGSPVFHWALVALMMVLMIGGLQRSEGLMGVAVGQAKADAPESYGVLRTGPLRAWDGTQRSIRVDAFDPELQADGMDRGPTPTVSVLDSQGRVIKTQSVYPNNPLKAGSLTVHRNDYGFAATLVRSNASGVVTGKSVQLIDFSETTTMGTTPVGYLRLLDAAGQAELKVHVTVPLDRRGDFWLKRMPEKPTARVVLTSPDGQPRFERVVAPGEAIPLPAGGSLLLESIGWYARLNVVHDSSIPLLYLAGIMAFAGLTLAVLTRQQSILAAVVEGPEGRRLVAAVRLYRNASTNRTEIQRELAEALGADQDDRGEEKGAHRDN